LTQRKTEILNKLKIIRQTMAEANLSAIRLRGVDWFGWATAGANNAVILTSETGVGEVLLTPDRAWILTNTIEAARFSEEEIPLSFEIWAGPWNDTSRMERFVGEQVPSGTIASDRPVLTNQECPLPKKLIAAKRRLLPSEIERYRKLGLESAEAMTEVLSKAQPEWTENQLAAEGAKALWNRGIHPTLTLAGGERRVARHRHPFPTKERLGSKAMLVFCARRHGLYANLTRWVYFKEPTHQERQLLHDAATIEAAALTHSRAGINLGEVYQAIVSAYTATGHTGEELNHHQGGSTGYLSREVVATPNCSTLLEENTALAWNPSLPGTKIEDTVLLTSQGIEILTVAPEWPTFFIQGRQRPNYWVQK
jgi:Xaa-Pro aminopeptidase